MYKISILSCLILFVVSLGGSLNAKTCEIDSSIQITTSQKSYGNDEQVEIVIKNISDHSIFSHKDIFAIQYMLYLNEHKKWINLSVYGQFPHVMYDIGPPEELLPGDEIKITWNRLIYIDGTLTTENAKKGTYKGIVLFQREKHGNWMKTISPEFIIK